MIVFRYDQICLLFIFLVYTDLRDMSNVYGQIYTKFIFIYNEKLARINLYIDQSTFQTGLDSKKK